MPISSIPRALTAAQILAEINKVATCTTNLLTDARTLNLDNLDVAVSSVGGVPLVIVDIWSAPLTVPLAITSAAGDKTLPNVVIPDLGTYTIVKAYGMFAFHSVLDDSGANNWTNTDTFIQVDKAAAGYINAISMPDGSVGIVASLRETNNFLAIGDIDISSRVANNATTNFKWTTVVCTGTNIVLSGVRTGIRLLIS